MESHTKLTRKSIGAMFVCALLGFIAITIASKNSFLYQFNDSRDIQVFTTTARCMLRGDVLYRDVFDVKGPFLYFFYICGLLLDSDSFVGIFAVEALLFVAFILISYGIASLYLKSELCRVIAAGATALTTACASSMYGGGQCEELALPFLAGAVYQVLRYFRFQYPKKIKWYQAMTVGACLAVVFWMKYTMIGLFGGVLIYVVYLQMARKTLRNLWSYAAWVFGGFMVASLPVFIYFGIHGAFADLAEVYFYDLIFCYKPAGGVSFHAFSNQFYQYYIGASALTAFAFVYAMFGGVQNKSRQESAALLWMMFFEAVGIGFSMHWNYSAQCMYTFAVLGVVGMLEAFSACKDNFKELLRKAARGAHRFLEFEWMTKCYYLPLLLAIVLLFGVDGFILPLMVIVGAIALAKVLGSLGKNTNKAGVFRKKVLLLKYLLLLVSYFAVTMLVTSSGQALLLGTNEVPIAGLVIALGALLVALEDYFLFTEEIDDEVRKLMEQWGKEYRASKPAMNCLIGFVAVMMYGFYCYSFSESAYDIGRALEGYPQYEMCEYIEESGIENPVIVNYNNIDPGVYWLTDTYPPGKFSCGFNLQLPELEEMYETYIGGMKADFVVTNQDTFSYEGYKMVYAGTDTYVNGLGNHSFYLWERTEFSRH